MLIALEVAVVDSVVFELISRSTCMFFVMAPATLVCSFDELEMFCTRLAIWCDTCSISSSAAPAFSASSAPPTTSVVLRSIDITASLVSDWIVLTSTSIFFVAIVERSASFWTSSATTAKPRLASPARDASIDAFSARIFVCSAISSISSTMLPISCELSPSRLMRFDVSWIVSRIVFMPAIVRRTASPPLCAISTEWRATSEQRSALPETSSIDVAIRAIDSDAAAACLAWVSAERTRWRDVPSVCLAAASTRIDELLMVATRPRSASIA